MRNNIFGFVFIGLGILNSHQAFSKQIPTEFTDEIYDEIVTKAPKADKFSSESEIKSLTSSYFDKYRDKLYKIDVKLTGYDAKDGYYLIEKHFGDEKTTESQYKAENAYGSEFIVTKRVIKSNDLRIGFLMVPSKIAREIDGKTGTLIFREFKPFRYDVQACGTSHWPAKVDHPFEHIIYGCSLKAKSVSFIVDGKDYHLKIKDLYI